MLVVFGTAFDFHFPSSFWSNLNLSIPFSIHINQEAVDQEVQQLLKYVSYDPNETPSIHFDEKAAKEDHASIKVMLMGNIMENAARIHQTKNIKDIHLYLPIYGNWCGPGHGSGETKGALDAQCKTHDLCYKYDTASEATCDQNLIDGIRKHYTEMKPDEQQVATVIASFFMLKSNALKKQS